MADNARVFRREDPTGMKPPVLAPSDPLASAREFIARHYTKHGRCILLHHADEFYAWVGSHYAVRPDAQMRAELYNFLEDARRRAGDSRLVPFQPSRSRVENVLDALRAVTHLTPEHRPPCWLVTGLDEPEPSKLMPCKNGAVVLSGGNLVAPMVELFNTHALDVEYTEDNAREPPVEWLRFLESLWPDDQESIDALQDWFGYVLSGETRQHKMLLLVGPKRSGKGTIGRVLRGLLGEWNVAAPTLASLQTNFGLQGLIAKPLAIIGDARLSGRADQQAVVERLLSISGEDAITIDRKHRDPITLQLPTRFMLLGNELPRLSDSSGAFASRFIVLVLTESWLGREDIELGDRLADELPRILHWALVGYRRVNLRERFVQPESATEAIGELEDLASPISTFVRDCCQLGETFEVAVDALYAEWRTWCEAQGRTRPGTKQTFGRDLRAVLPRLRMLQPRTDSGRQRFYQGITTMARDGTRASTMQRVQSESKSI